MSVASASVFIADFSMSGSEHFADHLQTSEKSNSSAYDLSGKTCFAIMPYGQSGVPGPDNTCDERQHFDAVYDFICETVQGLGIRPLRSDRTAEATPIHGRMLTDIIDADLAIVDITNNNPNVFYELGVRHTARRHTTLLIGYGETRPPFNLSGIRVISYDLADDELRARSKEKLRDAVVANLGSRATDSLVHALLPGLNLSRPHQPLKHVREAIEVEFSPKQRPEHASGVKGDEPSFVLGVIKGDLVDVDSVDVWVNPESTRMEMARIHDNTVSACIRYHGARKDRQGNIVRDIIYEDLRAKVGKANIEAGWVIVTPPGELKAMNVRAIFHVAAQYGEPCSGYHTIRTYTSVVSNALKRMDLLNASLWQRYVLLGSTRRLTSIIFPLVGTRASEFDPIDVTVSLVQEARKYLTLWCNTQIRAVYFLAYTQRDLELCEVAFQRLGMPLPHWRR
jgi:O-acetyl-ADP-ribose deacetylase (regulator of RNase III)